MNNSVVVLVGDDELGGVEEHHDGAGEPTTSLHRVPWRRWRCWPADPHKVGPDEETCKSMCGQMWSNVLGFRIMTFSY